MLTLKPVGRGRWRPMVIEIDAWRVPPMTVAVGQRIPIGGVIFRICHIDP
jgi:hypothetical protein